MRIEFTSRNAPPFKTINYGIQQDNAVRQITFVLNNKVDDIDLTEFTAYLKIVSLDQSFADKIPLDYVVDESDENKLDYTWTILRKQSAYPYLLVQLQFEKCDEEDVQQYQLETIGINLERSIKADEIVANTYPTIIQTLQQEIETIKKSAIHFYSSVSEFPTIGEDGAIYISTSTNRIYRWSDEKICYVCIGTNYDEIEYIICSLKGDN